MDKINEKAYVLVSPARNEEKYIEKVLDSVISQTILPQKWVVVSDGSTDRTDEIVADYAANHEFIHLLRFSGQDNYNFASKVNAFEAGVKELTGLDYEFIGNLDADVSFGPEYFEMILQEFTNDPNLGIGGGVIVEAQDGEIRERPWDRPWNVAGALQVFRRQCYEEIGGFVPLKMGAEDTVAQIMARMKGWEVKSFPEYKVLHHKPTGTGSGSVWRTRFNEGVREYELGYQATYFTAKCLRRVLQKPYFLGSVFRILGYCCALLRRDPILVSREFIEFHKQEQINRFKSLSKFLPS